QKVTQTMIDFTTLAATYSITAHDSTTGEVGVAVQTHQMGVGRLVPWLRPGVGAIATQALVNVSYGPNGLSLLANGASPEEVIAALTAADPGSAQRQVGVVDANGNAAAFTGTDCIAEAAHHVGEGYTVQANMMTKDTVIPAMQAAYEGAEGDLAARMINALEAAQAQGGDIRGKQSAALVIVPPTSENTPDWATLYNLRVDEATEPLIELGRLVRLRRAELISSLGHAAFADGHVDEALNTWATARAMAPELEEIAFWQAVTLADAGEIAQAVDVFGPVFEMDPLRDQWVELVTRLEAAKIITRPGAAAEFVAALGR
ncbi:MAG: DUF1028 domain-containing protein, partial [Chloroflexota bacterium]